MNEREHHKRPCKLVTLSYVSLIVHVASEDSIREKQALYKLHFGGHYVIYVFEFASKFGCDTNFVFLPGARKNIVYSLLFGKRSHFGQDLSQTLEI
jgi:hypothetical protein